MNIRIKQGASFSLPFYLFKSGTVSTIVGDLTGFSVTSKVRSTAEASAVAFSFTGTVTTAASALCEISLTAAETAALTAGTYVYDTIVQSGSTAYDGPSGIVVVTREISR